MNTRTFTGAVLAALVGLSVAVSAAPRIDVNSLLATVRTLASPEFEGRRSGTPGGLRARQWTIDRFKAIGLEMLKSDGGNVVGMCKGSAKARDVLVVSAHYDHLGIRNGAVYFGADDNASGVAVMLAIAEHCRRAPFKHDTIFAAFDAEEQGLQGSKAFVANPPIAKERLALNINLDMVSRGDKGELYAAGTYHWPKTKPPLQAVATRAPITLLFGHDRPEDGHDDWTKQSDHGSFHAAGIPFVYFGVEDHPDYHKPTDTPDKIDVAFFGHAAETILDAVLALDAAM